MILTGRVNIYSYQIFERFDPEYDFRGHTLKLYRREQAGMPNTGMPNAGPECRTPECRIRSAGMPNLWNALNGIPFNELETGN